MKRRLSLCIALVIVMALSMNMFVAAYSPASVAEGIPAPANAQIIRGEIFGTAPWGGNMANNFDMAWNGDLTTFFDPLGTGEHNYTGMRLTEKYVLTEVRLHPRNDGVNTQQNLNRFGGATIQGSDDGVTWTTLWSNPDVPKAEMSFHIVTADQLTNNTGWMQFRYVNNVRHGEIGEIELWGNPLAQPAPAPPAAPPPPAPGAAPVTPPPPTAAAAPQTNDSLFVFAAALTASALVFWVVKRRRYTV